MTDHALPERTPESAAREPSPTMVVGAADDRAEVEADRLADLVMAAIETSPPAGSLPGATSKVRRSTANAPRVAPAPAGDAGDPVGSEGGAVPQDVEQRIRRKLGTGKPLNADSGSEMGAAFGRSFSEVRVHSDGESSRISRSLGARAFTVGNDVFFGAGEYQPDSLDGKRILAHELGHVVAGDTGVHRKMVVRRFVTGSWFKKAKSPLAAKLKDDLDDVDDLGDESEAPEADETAPEQPSTGVLLADSIAYEESLGRFLFNHPVAKFAATAMVDRVITAVGGDLTKIEERFGRDGGSSAGQVGQDFPAILDAMHTGNLREKMTMVYNAMFGAVKDDITSIMSRGAWKEGRALGYDTKRLKKRKLQLMGPGSKDLYRDPGNPIDRKKNTSYEYRGTTRKKVEGDDTSKRTVGDLKAGGQRFGIDLSDREKAAQFDAGTEVADDEQLKWKEGGSLWEPNAKNKWVKKVQNSLRMPVVAGPSGTAMKMFQLWEFFKKPVPAAHWRAAILGYMLSSNDHSFHEMMLVCKDYGLPYKSGPKAYRSIEPFGERELRKGAAVGGLFPDELGFKRDSENGAMNLVTSDQLERADRLAADKGLSPDERLAVLALLAYTAENPAGYKFMNNLSSGMLLRPKFYHFIKKDKTLLANWKANKFNIRSLIDESKQLTEYATSALEGGALTTYPFSVFRGFGARSIRWYGKGKKLTFKKFLSTSSDEYKARQFAELAYKNGLNKKKTKSTQKRMVVEIDHHSGVRLDDVSMMTGDGNEKEVLFAPGAQFEVTSGPKIRGTGADVEYRMKWKQLGSPTNAEPEEFAKSAAADTNLEHLIWDEQAEQAQYELKMAFAPSFDPENPVDADGTLTLPTGRTFEKDVYHRWGLHGNLNYELTKEEVDLLSRLSAASRRAFADAVVLGQFGIASAQLTDGFLAAIEASRLHFQARA